MKGCWSTATFPDLGSMVMIPINIASAKLVLENAARELNGLSALPVLPDDLPMKVMKIGFASRSLASAAQAVGILLNIADSKAGYPETLVWIVQHLS